MFELEYKIVTGSNAEDLTKKVNALQASEWNCQGGAFISPDGQWNQAMVLFDEEEEE